MTAVSEIALRKALESLSIPVPATLPDGMDMERLLVPAGWASAFITATTARSIYRGWYPSQVRDAEDPAFVTAFRDVLRRGVSLGLRLDRFREISARLPGLAPRSRWDAPFEDAVDEVGPGSIRLYLNPRAYEDYQRDTPIHADKDADNWRKILAMMSDGLFYELGLTLPPIEVRRDDDVGENDFRVEWNDLVLPIQHGLGAGRVLVNDTVDRLTLLNINGEEATNPANGSECATVPAEVAEICQSAGLTVWEPASYIVLALSAVLRRNAPAFVTRSLVDLFYLQLESFDPELVSLAEERLDRDTLVNLLRGLLEEEVSIRNMPGILRFCLRERAIIRVEEARLITFDVANALYVSGPCGDVDIRALVDNARITMRRTISHKYSRGSATLVVYLLDPLIESRLQQPAAFTEFERQVLLSAVRQEIGDLPSTASQPVILTSMNIRYRMRNLIRPEFPNVSVLSYNDLSPDMNIQPIARISADDLAEPRPVLLLEELGRRLRNEGGPPAPHTLEHAHSSSWVHRIPKISDFINRRLDRDRLHSPASRRGQRSFVREHLCAAAEAAAGSDRRLLAWRDLVLALERDCGAGEELRAMLSRIADALEGLGPARLDDAGDDIVFVARIARETAGDLPERPRAEHAPVDLEIDRLPEAARAIPPSTEEIGEELASIAGLLNEIEGVDYVPLIDPDAITRAWKRAASLVGEGKSDRRLVRTLEVLAAMDPTFPSLGLVLSLGNRFAGNPAAAAMYLQVQLGQADRVHKEDCRKLLRRWGHDDFILAD